MTSVHLLAEYVPGSGHYYRELHVSPTQTHLLALRDDHQVDVFSLTEHTSRWTPLASWESPASVLALEWRPLSEHEGHPPSLVFAVSVRDHPVQLIKVSKTLSMVSSFPIIDHIERVVAPHAFVFSADGLTLYGGCESAFVIMDVTSSSSTPSFVYTTPTRRSKDGLKGILSALALNSDHLLAAGSFSGAVGLYNVNENPVTCMALFETFNPHGVVQLAFHPNGNDLFVASRQSDTSIEVYDVRDVSSPKALLDRPSTTNQRLFFDFNPTASYLVTGTSTGLLQIYSTAIAGTPNVDPPVLSPVSKHFISDNAVSAVVFATRALVACEGERIFGKPGGDSEGEEGSSEEENDHADKAWSLRMYST